METIRFHPLMQITEEELTRIRQQHNLDRKQIQENIDAIDEWIKKQDHLVEGYKYMGHNMLERLHILSKGSIEATKTKIDKLFTARAMIPELIRDRTVEEFEKFVQHVSMIPVAKLNSAIPSRVCFASFIDEDLDDFNFLTFFRYIYLIAEFRLRYDYCFSDAYIFDLKHSKMNLLTKINPVILKKAEILATQVYGFKIKGIHFVNAPLFVDRIVAIVKRVLSEKLAARVHVHNSYESLYKHVPKEILPADYGGNGQSVVEIFEQWKNFVKSDEGRKILKESDKLISDESKRNSAKFNEEYLGMPGSFKQLNVD